MPPGKVPSKSLPAWHFELETSRRALCQQFATLDLAGFGCDDFTVGLEAAGALLGYAKLTQGQASATSAACRCTAPSAMCAWMPRHGATWRSPRPCAAKPAPTLLSLLDTCATNMGSRLLHHWLHHPLRDRNVLNARLDAVKI